MAYEFQKQYAELNNVVAKLYQEGRFNEAVSYASRACDLARYALATATWVPPPQQPRDV